MTQKLKYSSEIEIFPKDPNEIVEIEPLKGSLILSISTMKSRVGDRMTIFLSNLGSEKRISFDGGIDGSEFPIDRSGYLELVFNGKNFVLPFIGNLRGPEGKEGRQGPIGEQGPIGLTGSAGSDGSSGTSGVSIQGPQGISGLDGSSGTSGISIQGPKGEKGDEGINGLKGRCECDYCKDLR